MRKFLFIFWVKNFIFSTFFQRETRPKIWAYLLWKQTQFQHKQEDEEENPWKLYQTWMQLEESTRQSWLVAGGTIQSFEKVSSLVLVSTSLYKICCICYLVRKRNLTGDACKDHKNIDAGKANYKTNANRASCETRRSLI